MESFVVALSPARKRRRRRGGSRAIQSAFLTLEADQDLPLPAFPDELNPYRGKVDGHPVLEARAEKSVNVRVRRSVYTAVLVDGKDTLRAAGGAAERLGLPRRPVSYVSWWTAGGSNPRPPDCEPVIGVSSRDVVKPAETR